MAQSSRPWTYGLGDGIGAAADGSYTADQWDNIFEAAFGQGAANYGVLRGYLNALLVTTTAVPSASIRVLTGGAFVKGKFYESSAIETFPAGGFPAPAANPRIDRVVLRASWATRTVRIYRIPGAENPAPAPPALTQVDGVTWDIPLAQIAFAFPWGGTVAAADITDERYHIEPRQREFDAIVGTRPGDYATVTAALADGHLSIFIRAGTYAEPGSITLASGTWLCGEDPIATTLNMGANQVIITEGAPNFASHVTVERLTIDSADLSAGLDIVRGAQTLIRQCVFTDAALTTQVDSDNVRIEGCHFYNTSTDVVIDSPGTIVRDNTFINCRLQFNDDGLESVAEGNRIIFDAAGTCLLVSGSCDGLRIAHNMVAMRGIHVATIGIQVNASYNQTIIGNHVTAGGSAYILSCSSSTITGNTAYDCTVGFHVEQPNNTLVGNIVRGCSGNGIELLDTADYCIIKANEVTANGGDGIDIPTGCDQVIVGDNIIRSNTGWGIDYAGDRELVLGNIVLNNTAGQIDATGATNQVEEHNIVA